MTPDPDRWLFQSVLYDILKRRGFTDGESSVLSRELLELDGLDRSVALRILWPEDSSQ